MRSLTKILMTAAVVAVAVVFAAYKYWDYINNPWTRNGQVMANVIQVSPRISGPIVNLPIVDNQFVKAGDLLFEIDPRTFKTALEQAVAKLDKTRDDLLALAKQVEAAEASVEQYKSSITEAESSVSSTVARLKNAKITVDRYRPLVEKGSISQQQLDDIEARYDVALANKQQADASLLESRSALIQAEANLAQARANLGAPGEDNAQLRAAKAAVREAELDYEFTEVKASVDGYVTNLNLRLGSQAVENQPALALVDVSSYRIDAFFRETFIDRVRPGDRAIVTLMTYADKPIEARVDSIGWGISQEDGSTGAALLPNVKPTFEWIRLAQRIPVRVHLEGVPEGVDLRVGTTASVLVMTGTSDQESTGAVPAAPKALQ